MPRTTNPTAEPVSPPPETAADVMIPGPRSCSPFSKAVEAALILKTPGCIAVPVIDAGRPVGTITVHDLAGILADHPELAGRTVAEIMAKDPVTVNADAPLSDLYQKVAGAGSRPVLVVDRDGGLRGMVHATPNGKKANPPAVDRPAPPAMTRQPWWAWARPASLRDLFRETGSKWMADNVPRLGASLAFYSVLSISPLFIIVIAIATLVFGEDAARGLLVGQIRDLVGEDGGKAIQDVLKNARKPATGTIATILGVATLLFGASGVFGELQDTLNTIWGVRNEGTSGFFRILRDRFFSFLMVLGTGFLLLVSLILSAAISALFNLAGGLAPDIGAAIHLVNTITSFGVVALLFALMFKLLPDARIAWKDVWVGAILTTILFMVGKAAIGLYLGYSSYGSAYGAAGSMILLLVWIYYTSQILYFGAEFTQVYANRYGSRIRPTHGSVKS